MLFKVFESQVNNIAIVKCINGMIKSKIFDMKNPTNVKLMLAALSILWLNGLQAQTYETDADAYWELEPVFTESADEVVFWFNMEIDDSDLPFDVAEDHVAEIDLKWNGIILCRVGHENLSTSPGSDYTEAIPTNAYIFAADGYREYTHTALKNAGGIMVSYSQSHHNSYSSYTTTRVGVTINKAILADVLAVYSATFEATGLYRDRTVSFTNNEPVGTHTFDVDVASITEIQVNFSQNDSENYIDASFNLEHWDVSDGAWSSEYDHIGYVEISWNDEVLYRVEHGGLYSSNMGSDYSMSHPTTTRWESTGSYDVFTNNDAAGMTASYHNSVDQNGDEITRVYLHIPYSALPDFASSGGSTTPLQLSAYYYLRGYNKPSYSSSSAQMYAGTYHSNDITMHPDEENQYGAEEAVIVASVKEEGYVEIKFRTEVLSDAAMDNIACATFYAHNTNKGEYEVLATLRQQEESCSFSNPAHKTFTGQDGRWYDYWVADANKTSWPSWGSFDIINGDSYLILRYYFDNDDLNDDIKYYVEGDYRVREPSGSTQLVSTNHWWGQNNITRNASDVITMPTVPNFNVSVLADDCSIAASWHPYESFGTYNNNRVTLLRDGVVKTSWYPDTSTFTDTDIHTGIDYAYQVRSEYVRDFNDRLQGPVSAAIVAQQEKTPAPYGLALTQGSCAADITVDWAWTGDDPISFTIERKGTTGDFQAVVNGLGGGLRTYIDGDNVVSGEVYSYRIAAVQEPCANQLGIYSDIVQLTGDTIDITVSIEQDALETSKGYFDDRTELFWSTSGQNDQYLDRFRIYAREVGSIQTPTLLATVPESDISWQHYTGDAGTVYEYFVIAERVVQTECGNLVTASFDVAALNGSLTKDALPSSGDGLAYAVGFRYPTGIVNGNITYEGGSAVENVKVVAEKYSGENGNSLYFDGNDYVSVPHSASLMCDTAFTISMWVKPQSLGASSVLFQKNQSFGLEYSGTNQNPFVFIRDTTGTAYVLAGESNSMETGNWCNLTTTYSSSSGVLKIYINGVPSGDSLIVPENLRLINPSTTPLYMACQKGNSYFYQGYMDEVKLYNRVLNDEEVLRASGAVSATDAEGLVGYWKMLAGVGDEIFDASRVGSSHHKNDGIIYNADWSTDIPSTSQLGFAGYTDANGNYSIKGIGYQGTGENFNIVPIAALGGVVHEFDPATRTLFMGEGNNIFNGVDFEDVSSFKVSGYVRFDFGNNDSGSEDISILIDGLPASSGGVTIKTDADGYFEIDVPIGEHWISLTKNGHTFADGGRFPAQGTFEFIEPVSGIQFWDTTTKTFAGKVVGGTAEGDKKIGFNHTQNNIGQAYFSLSSQDNKINVDVQTDSLTGEFFVNLPPKKYISSAVKYQINNVDIVASSDITPIDLGHISTLEETYETDSVFVNEVFSHVDSVGYHLRRDYLLRNTPNISVTNTNGDPISGEMFYYYTLPDQSVTSIDVSHLSYPAFTSNKDYQLKISAQEIYQNLDNLQFDTVPLNDGELTVNNAWGLGYDVDEFGEIVQHSPGQDLAIEGGEYTYHFKAGEPELNENTSVGEEHKSFTKGLNMSLQVGADVIYWPNPNNSSEQQLAYVMGGKSVGNSFVTTAPTTLEYILRDPPGSNSFASWESGETKSTSTSFYGGGNFELGLKAGIGLGFNTLVGGGICGVGETAEGSIEVTAGMSLSIESESGGEYTYESTSLRSFGTNAEYGNSLVSSEDLFVSSSQNLKSGLAIQVKPIALNDCGDQCYGDTITDTYGNEYKMGRVLSTYLSPEGVPTYFLYTERHIATVLIPDLEEIRNTFLNSSVYTSHLQPTDANYGSNNDDPVWGSQATTTNSIRTEVADFDGPSYTFSWDGNDATVDSVRWANQQIRLWKEALAQNEIEKWEAITYGQADNVSIASGVPYTVSETSSNSGSAYSSFETSAGSSAGLSAEFDGWGFSASVELDMETSVKRGGTEEVSTESTVTTEYTIRDDDPDDAFSINIYEGQGNNGPIFQVFGGQSSCPHEGEVSMIYATPEFIQYLIDSKTGVINRKQEEASAFGLSGNTAEQAQSYGEADNIQASVSRLQALLAELTAGEVVLSEATLQREKPKLNINGAKQAQAYNVPSDQAAYFNLLLKNESESGDPQYYDIEVLDETNPNGLQISIDGEFINTPRAFLVPGLGAIQKVLTVERGPYEYIYEGVGVVLHSQCQYDPTADLVLIADTVYFDVHFLPTCTDIEIISPDDQWAVNSSFNDEQAITVGSYDINGVGFEKVKLQYKPSTSSQWVLLQTFFRDTTIADWNDEPTLPTNGNTFTYNWDLGQLPDGDYDIRAVAACALAETNSDIYSGKIDRLNPMLFGAAQPSDGVLSPGEEISIQFNETINEGLLSPANFDIRGVLNGGEIRHDASISFDGNSNTVEIEQLNLANKSFTIEFYARKGMHDVEQVMISHKHNNGLSIGFNAANQVYFNLDDQSVLTNTTITDDYWHHYTITYNAETSDALIYIDAELEGVNNSFVVNYQLKEDLIIGASHQGTLHFTGNMHELRIWNKELSLGTIAINAVQRMVGNEAGLLYNWMMEEAQGVLVHDKVRGKHGLMNANWVVDPVGFALSLTGNENQAELGSVSFNGDADYSVEFWFKSDGGTDEVILSNGIGTSEDANTSGWSLGIDVNGNFYAQSNNQLLTSANVANDGVWHHVALVSKAQSNVILYIDAIEVGGIENELLNGFAGPALWIGQQGWYNGSLEQNSKQFIGYLDELRLWNISRTHDQIDRDRYNKLRGDEVGLVEYYPFENYSTSQGVTSVLSDRSNQSENVLAINDEVQLSTFATLVQSTPPIKLPRPVEFVNFTYAVNNDQIIITPNIEPWRIENVQLDITVSNVQDLNGNTITAPIGWTAYVDRNQVVWQDSEFNLETLKGEAISFETAIVNNSGQSMVYEITNIPSWLQLSSTSGSLGPLSTLPITCTVPSNANSGFLQQDILLYTDFGFAERLELNVQVKNQPPIGWEVDPYDYQYSMNIIGQVSYEGIMSRNEDDLIAAFVGNECRAVQNLAYLSSYDNYQAFMSIYSNYPDGENLEFKVWDALTGTIHTEVSSTLASTEFVADAFYGLPSEPVLFNADNYLEGTIAVKQGWNWVSFNLGDDDILNTNSLLSNLVAEEGDLIKTRHNVLDGDNYTQIPYFDSYVSGYGWYGSITQNGGAQTNVLYKLKVNQSGTIQYKGRLIEPQNDTLNVVSGWNYIGYIGKQEVGLSVGMSHFIAHAGDVIKNQHQSAIYDESVGWIGSLHTLEPNVGYMLNAYEEQRFTYPSYINNLNQNRLLTDDANLYDESPWELQKNNYASNMVIIAKVVDVKDFSIDEPGYLAAFIDGECRAISYPQWRGTELVYILTVGAEYDSKTIDFEYFNIGSSNRYVSQDTVVYITDAIEGSLDHPVEIVIDTELSPIHAIALNHSIRLEPNLFSDYALLTVDLPEWSVVESIIIQDLKGRTLQQLDVSEQSKGSQYYTIQRAGLAPGVYMVEVLTSEERYTTKMIIINK